MEKEKLKNIGKRFLIFLQDRKKKFKDNYILFSWIYSSFMLYLSLAFFVIDIPYGKFNS